MKQFKGFPARMQFTAVPNLFFSSLLPQIKDAAELKTTLHILQMLYAKKGYPRFLTYNEMLGNESLNDSLKDEDDGVKEALNRSLQMAIERGTILHLVVDMNGKPADIYFLNSAQDRKVIDKIKNGELIPSGIKSVEVPGKDTGTGDLPDIFTLYEQNIGMLTPIIAEELGEAEKMYPEDWIKDAIKEAVSLNKRNWRYIARILENWASEGRSDGTYKRDSQKSPDKYSGQKYGHIIKH